MHHLHQPALALTELSRVLKGDGSFIFEYANKRNIKAMIRYSLGLQKWSPFERQPYEFVHLNFNFHPSWMEDTLRLSGFSINKELAISNFRLAAVKRRIPTSILVQLDTMLASSSAKLKLSPSVVVRCEKKGGHNNIDGFFQCPACSSLDLLKGNEAFICRECGRHWRIVDGIYDFRSPL